MYDLPTYRVKIGKSFRARVDVAALYNLLQVLAALDVQLAVIEEPGAREGQSYSTGKAIGEVVGMLLIAATAAGVPVAMAYPHVWKPRLNCQGDKSRAVARYRELHPFDAEQIVKGARGAVSHDRAEAGLLAYYADVVLKGKAPPPKKRATPEDIKKAKARKRKARNGNGSASLRIGGNKRKAAKAACGANEARAR